jgi:pyroglutamyl-peptidase
MKALVTGFEPFGGGRTNASIEAVRRVQPRVADIDVVVAELPTSFARSPAALAGAIARVEPDIVLCVGQAGERPALCVERVAVNIQDADIADNDGARPIDKVIVAGGPAAYLATLPVRTTVAALQAARLPAQLSMSAGTFVCNHVFYHLMHLAAGRARAFRGGFLHVPALSRSGTEPAMTLAEIVRGVEITLRASTSKE